MVQAHAVGGSDRLFVYWWRAHDLPPAFAGGEVYLTPSQGSALSRFTLGFTLPPAFAG